ncbi:unnamed protein product [Knipowitschia caucasica]
MTIYIDNWVGECDKCQRKGKPLAAVLPLENIKVSAVWELVGIDLTGPLPKTPDGFMYMLTATDYFSKWVEAYPLKSKSALEVAQRLCSIIYRHGCPKRILSDQGREFVNELNNELCTLLHIERSVTAAYHPQTNGLDVKTNHNIKQALTTLVNDRQNNWDTYLKGVLFALRSKVHTSTKQTPFRLLYGREAVFPAELPVHVPLSITLPEEATYNACIEGREEEMKTTHSKAEKKMAQAHEKQRLAYAKKTLKKYRAVSYSIGQEVLLFNMRKKGRKGGRIEPDFSGPYTIEAINGKLATLANLKGVTLNSKYSLDHLKPYKQRRPKSDYSTNKR